MVLATEAQDQWALGDSTAILRTKLYSPSLPPDLVPRDDMVARLFDPVSAGGIEIMLSRLFMLFTLSYDYLGDLYQWEKQIRNAPVWSGSICVIQGDKDSIVKWKYNLPFMETKVENLEVHIIPRNKI